MKTTEQLMQEFLNKGGKITQVAPRKKDPRLVENRKGSVFSAGRKSVTLKNEGKA